jgi:hypothetical protein
MAGFPSAAGYNNFQDSALFPVHYSKKVLLNLQKAAVADAITNTQYEGEIRDFGASVKIVKAPTVTVSDYVRGMKLNDQTIDPESTELTIDQAKYYSFGIDIIEQQQSHLDLADMTLIDATYQLRNSYDSNILTKASADATSVGSVTVGQGVGETTPLDLLGIFRQELDEANYPQEDSWIVVSPQFIRYMNREDSRFVVANEMGVSKSAILNNGLAFTVQPHSFSVYMSNNLPANTIIAGHKSALATAKTIVKARVIENPDSFGKKYQGLMVWGRETLRADGLLKATVNYGA